MTPATATVPTMDVSTGRVAPRAPSTRDRLVAGSLIAGVRLMRLLPDGLVYRAAHVVGAVAWRVMPARRTLAHANLVRICGWLVANGTASPRVAAAVRDPRRMDRLVRDAFGHWVRTYAESAMAPRYDRGTLRARIHLDDPDETRAALAPVLAGEPGRIFVGFHLGSVELAALYAARESSLPVAGPMETVVNPALQAYFEHVRSSLGVGIVPVEDAAREMIARLERGQGVAIVADRVIAGVGSRVDLFGAATRLPAGPSVLAATSGAQVFVIAVRRVGWARWAARVERIQPGRAADGRRGQVRSILGQEARLLEQFVADAPEQWWTVMFRIWDDTP